jgi:hypothetical protein
MNGLSGSNSRIASSPPTSRPADRSSENSSSNPPVTHLPPQHQHSQSSLSQGPVSPKTSDSFIVDFGSTPQRKQMPRGSARWDLGACFFLSIQFWLDVAVPSLTPISSVWMGCLCRFSGVLIPTRISIHASERAFYRAYRQVYHRKFFPWNAWFWASINYSLTPSSRGISRWSCRFCSRLPSRLTPKRLISLIIVLTLVGVLYGVLIRGSPQAVTVTEEE